VRTCSDSEVFQSVETSGPRQCGGRGLRLSINEEEVGASASQSEWRRERPPTAEPCPQAEARETGATGGRVRKVALKTRVSLTHFPANRYCYKCPLFIGLSYHFYRVYNNIPQLLQSIPGIFFYSSSVVGAFLPCRHLVPGLHGQPAQRASGFGNGLLHFRRRSPPRPASGSLDEPSGLRLQECQNHGASATQVRRSSACVSASMGGDRAGVPAPRTDRDRVGTLLGSSPPTGGDPTGASLPASA